MLAARSARFYHSLCAKFDIAFADFSDRDAGFYATIRANPKAWFTPADLRRHVLYAAEFVRLAHVRLADPSRSTCATTRARESSPSSSAAERTAPRARVTRPATGSRIRRP